MRALQVFQRVSTALGATLAPSTLPAAIMGAGSCRLRGLNSSALSREQTRPEPVVCDALDQEFDRSDDAATAAMREREYEERAAARAALGAVPEVDLDTELDRDDPLLADKSHLWDAPAAGPPPEVDLDTEFDRDDPLLADKRNLWECPEPPCPADVRGEMDLMADAADLAAPRRMDAEASEKAPPGGTMAGNTPFGQGGRQSSEQPDPRIGQYRGA